ncbi:hypothetical protein BX600DRAFT_100176 [Xylariales sp. PMI_506]|nr:hypothetical protein BX600DRAFT_100176 [Xylariales sp. PMI_506]
MKARQDSDNLAWDRSDESFEEATKHAQRQSTCRKVESLAEGVYGKPALFIRPLMIGGFNALYPVRIEDSPDTVLVRLPLSNQSVFPEEKTFVEAATIACISQQSQLPVPKVFHYGVDADLGPFMVIQDLGSRRCISDALEAPRGDSNETIVLNPDISENKLKSLYTKLAHCILQLAQPTFPRIGALRETSPGLYNVEGRPITLNMINMITTSNIPASIFPPKGTTYQTTDEWYVALADMQMATLIFQHNDITSSEDDCKTKYVARQLFRRLAKQGRLSRFGFAEDDWSAAYSKYFGASGLLSAPDGSGPFRLWSDDFRPVNVVVDEDDQLLGAIDWEFAYVGPTQFILDSPWWLLLDIPELWDHGIDDWTKLYEQKLKVWLSAMEEAEKEMSSGSFRLSRYMQESWETGRFWLNYAARKSWAFDTIYWKYLDERFFGERADIPTEELWKTRVHLLSEEERAGMEPLVQMKMEESKERILIEWEPIEAKQRLSFFLFD